MKRAVLVLFTLLALSCAQAQSLYVGLHVDVTSDMSNLSVVIPHGGLQLGVPVLDNVELRASYLIGLATLIQADVLYTRNVSDTLRVYSGAGGDTMEFGLGGDRAYGVHAAAGIEYWLGSGIGLFGEVQPLFLLKDFGPNTGVGNLFAKLNLGVNLHF